LLLKLDIAQHAPLPDGPKIIAPNHPSTSDPGLVLLGVREQASVLIDETLFKVPVFGRYLRHAGHVPVVEGNRRAAFEKARRLLQAGRTVVIFPEGSISPREGGLHRARTGVARLALLTGAPVIPVGIHLDRERIHPVETVVEGKVEVGTWYLRGPYAMTFGRPMALRGDVEDRAYVRALSRQVMQHIGRLAGESERRLVEAGKLEPSPLVDLVAQG
jgi:1-acyl-sn-glycerol-3-phosphate acyltransferase